MEKNAEITEKFLAATSEADQWMCKTRSTAQIGTRSILGLSFSCRNCDGFQRAATGSAALCQQLSVTLECARMDWSDWAFWKATFDVNKNIEPKPILKVMKDNPELFSDLPPIPAHAAIGPGFVFKP